MSSTFSIIIVGVDPWTFIAALSMKLETWLAINSDYYVIGYP